MERLQITDFVKEVIWNVEGISDEQREQLVAVLLSKSSLEDVKQRIREVANG